ncbi:glycosyltransferase [bacterium]|nr:glycosyltransferase [bacterium]
MTIKENNQETTSFPEALKQIVVLSTYSPREDGIATFTKDLLDAILLISAHQINIRVAAINPSALHRLQYPEEVSWQINPESTADYKKLALSLNNNPQVAWVIIQHEYGIFGGNAGDHLLSFTRNLNKPLLITFHTVLSRIPDELKIIQDELMNRAETIVVLTDRSRDILIHQYPDQKAKIHSIPHGIHPLPFSYPEDYKKSMKMQKTINLTTFGLLSRGKGIEYVIRSLPPVVKQFPQTIYRILGKTHPNILLREGESYRLELMKLVKELHLEHHVYFHDAFMTLQEILSYLQSTDIYIATSTDPQQAVSGTLSYALGTGRATLSTQFSQSEDFVTPDVGRLVPPKQPEAFTQALLTMLQDQEGVHKMHLQAYRKTRHMIWPNIGYQYLDLLIQTKTKSIPHLFLLNPIKLDHLREMTDQNGLFQFSNLKKKNVAHGYTLDDNARALIVMNMILQSDYPAKKTVLYLAKIYLNFIDLCQTDHGTFFNYIDIHKNPTLQNQEEELESANARALWSLAYTLHANILPPELLRQAQKLWDLSESHLASFHHPHAVSILLQALYYQDKTELMTTYADQLTAMFESHSTTDWCWFEDHMTYDNGAFIEGLLLAYKKNPQKQYRQTALKALDFLVSHSFWGGVLMPIGQNGWFKKDSTPAMFDQQPIEACSLILALIQAYKITKLDKYWVLLNKAYTWFIGNNILGKSLYDPGDGSCSDGLTPYGLNLNHGAESQLSYLLSRLTLQYLLATQKK